MPKIVVLIDGVTIKEMQLTKDRTTVGRRPYNDVVIDNLAVSGEHAVFRLASGLVSVEDLGSTNGVYVNGQAIKQNDDLGHRPSLADSKFKLNAIKPVPRNFRIKE